MRYVLNASDEHSCFGGKAGALATLTTRGFPVPDWFVVIPEAFNVSLKERQRQEVFSGNPEHMRSVLADLTPADIVREEIVIALEELCPDGEFLAVRSSALEEDGSESSFAGQFDSFLFVPPDDVPEKVAAVWMSGFNERVQAYRRERGMSILPTVPAVLVQRMVNADAAGVAFSSDPISGRRGIAVVSGVFGLGTALVSGECDADTWRVDRSGSIIDEQIADKRNAHRPSPRSEEGVRSEPVSPEISSAPCLASGQIKEVATLSRRAARHFGRPQDIEWAIEGGILYLLQSRPITSLESLPDPDGNLNIWDNSNIVESYGGVTTPLTFSFARHIYEEVYRRFCHIMAVPTEAIAANERIFPRMLGLIRGRVYYNLLNWYRLLAMLPGFATNRRFMEQMMGVKEGIPEEVLSESVAFFKVGPWRDRINLGFSLAGLIKNHLCLESAISEFYHRLDKALAPPSPPLEELRGDELVAHYRMLEDRLLTRWDAPLVNDFFAMMFFGLLGRTTSAWCRDENGTLQNDLISGEGGIVSAEPARRVREMAEIAATDPVLTEILAEGKEIAVLSAITVHKRFATLYEDYLARFGDRCLDELKLESSTLHDDPLPLQRSVGEFARRIRSGRATAPPDEAAIRSRAEELVRSSLRRNPFKSLIHRWILKNARKRVRDRENLRFERTRLFGRVRRIFVELGKRFHAEGILNDPHDIFWLEKDEIFGLVEGTGSSTNLCELVALRKKEFAVWETCDPPPNRFETRGMINHSKPFSSTEVPGPSPEGDCMKGIGCCPGVVRGPVKVIIDPRGAAIRQGEILVAERTDPGWIMLFPACSGLLVERGSLLSHSAIVARELGIPAVVSVAGLTKWLVSGDLVEMDGASGIIRKLSSAESIGAGL